MIGAEEYGVTFQSVDEQLKNANPNIKRLLGELPGSGASMGLDDKWAYNIIKKVEITAKALNVMSAREVR